MPNVEVTSGDWKMVAQNASVAYTQAQAEIVALKRTIIEMETAQAATEQDKPAAKSK